MVDATNQNRVTDLLSRYARLVTDQGGNQRVMEGWLRNVFAPTVEGSYVAVTRRDIAGLTGTIETLRITRDGETEPHSLYGMPNAALGLHTRLTLADQGQPRNSYEVALFVGKQRIPLKDVQSMRIIDDELIETAASEYERPQSRDMKIREGGLEAKAKLLKLWRAECGRAAERTTSIENDIEHHLDLYKELAQSYDHADDGHRAGILVQMDRVIGHIGKRVGSTRTVIQSYGIDYSVKFGKDAAIGFQEQKAYILPNDGTLLAKQTKPIAFEDIMEIRVPWKALEQAQVKQEMTKPDMHAWILKPQQRKSRRRQELVGAGAH